MLVFVGLFIPRYYNDPEKYIPGTADQGNPVMVREPEDVEYVNADVSIVNLATTSLPIL